MARERDAAGDGIVVNHKIESRRVPVIRCFCCREIGKLHTGWRRRCYGDMATAGEKRSTRRDAGDMMLKDSRTHTLGISQWWC